jgi:hypothetical protein
MVSIILVQLCAEGLVESHAENNEKGEVVIVICYREKDRRGHTRVQRCFTTESTGGLPESIKSRVIQPLHRCNKTTKKGK